MTTVRYSLLLENGNVFWQGISENRKYELNKDIVFDIPSPFFINSIFAYEYAADNLLFIRFQTFPLHKYIQ